MNKLYLLMIWTCMSCHSDFMTTKSQTNTPIVRPGIVNFISLVTDSIQWNRSNEMIRQSQITESIFFKAEFDYYACTVIESSNPGIQVYFNKKSIYFMSTKMNLLRPHSLEYFDIDDYHGFIESPAFNKGIYKNYTILKIPLKSNLDCLSEVSVILIFDDYFDQNHITD